MSKLQKGDEDRRGILISPEISLHFGHSQVANRGALEREVLERGGGPSLRRIVK